jgi:hypothetical protein
LGFQYDRKRFYLQYAAYVLLVHSVG